jgi:hypothetical protein
MAISTKDLGSIVLPAGTIKVMLWYDDTTVSSSTHIPTAAQTFVNFPKVTEQGEFTAGVLQLGEVTFSIRDNYDNYSAGVWHKIMKGSETQFRFLLDEGAGDTFLFWGVLVKSKTRFTELYIENEGASGRYVRGYNIQMQSILKKVSDVSIDTMITDLVSNCSVMKIDAGVTRLKGISVSKVIGSILESAFGSTDVSIGSTAVFPSSNNDFQYQDAEASWQNFSLDDPPNSNWVGIILQKSNDSGGTYPDISPYIDANHALYWGLKYKNALEFLGAFIKNLGAIARYRWNVSTSKHQIEISWRGRVGDLVTFGSLAESSGDLESEVTVNDVRVQKRSSASSDSFKGLDLLIEYYPYSHSGEGSIFENFYTMKEFETDIIQPVTEVRIYDYLTSAYFSDYPNILFEDLVEQYYRNRLTTIGRKYIRIYKGIKGTFGGNTNHTNVKQLCRTAIHDGVSSSYYYANKVIKDVDKNILKIDWIKE